MSDPYSMLSLKAAEIIKKQIQSKPNSCLALPSGRTPLLCYKNLSEWSAAGEINWQEINCFALDEYVDSDESHSFRYYLQENLYKNTNLPDNQHFSPLLVDDYDALIAQKGGIDLAILGLGNNGHIAFNEPGTPVASWTHSVWLSESTRKANAELFKDTNYIPTRAVTMGLRTILNSKSILLMVSGKQKFEALRLALYGPITPELPASLLQNHKNLVVLTDFSFQRE